MSVTQTSIEALSEYKQAGKAAEHRELIVEALLSAGHPMTRAEIREATGLPVNIVTGRVADFFEGALCGEFTIEKSGKKICNVGGKRVEALAAKVADVETLRFNMLSLRAKYKASQAKCQGLERALKAAV